MTNYNERLDRVLSDYAEAIGSYVNFGSPFNSDEDNIAGAEALYQTSYNEAKQAITADRKRVALEARIDELEKFVNTTNRSISVKKLRDRLSALKSQQEEV